MKRNLDKCYFLLGGNENRSVNIGNNVNKNSQNEKLLGVSIERKGTFHITLNIYAPKLVEHGRLWRL